jgi:hypothetical protein
MYGAAERLLRCGISIRVMTGWGHEQTNQPRQIKVCLCFMGKLKLTVNEEKTRICKVPEGKFDFLGHIINRLQSVVEIGSENRRRLGVCRSFTAARCRKRG